MKKQYRYSPAIGKARHVVSSHDGVQTHKDGSPFFGIKICKNKRALAKHINQLRREGYTEQ